MTLPRTGFIDHIGIGVPDLGAAKQYYDELMAVLGLREWFDTGPGGPLNYGPDGGAGRTAVLLPSRGTDDLLTPRDGPSSPRIPGREPRGRSRSARVGSCTRRHHPRRAQRVPPVRASLLCDLLARSSWDQARGGLPHPRGELRHPRREGERRRARARPAAAPSGSAGQGEPGRFTPSKRFTSRSDSRRHGLRASERGAD